MPTHTPRPTATPSPTPTRVHFCDEYLLEGHERQVAACKDLFVGHKEKNDGVMVYEVRYRLDGVGITVSGWCEYQTTRAERLSPISRSYCIARHLWEAWYNSKQNGLTQLETLSADFWCPAIPIGKVTGQRKTLLGGGTVTLSYECAQDFASREKDYLGKSQ